jgi:hypothetical protein
MGGRAIAYDQPCESRQQWEAIHMSWPIISGSVAEGPTMQSNVFAPPGRRSSGLR